MNPTRRLGLGPAKASALFMAGQDAPLPALAREFWHEIGINFGADYVRDVGRLVEPVSSLVAQEFFDIADAVAPSWVADENEPAL